MKKIKLTAKILIVLLAVLLLWIGVNQLDTSLDTNVLTVKDLPKASYEKNNGFYYLFSFEEPLGTDVSSDEIIMKYRRYFDPQYDNKKYMEGVSFRDIRRKFRLAPFKKLRDLRRDLDFTNFPVKHDWCEVVLKHRDRLKSNDPAFNEYMDRHLQMLKCPVFQDFLPPEVNAPLPNLLAWLVVSKIYTAQNMLTALEGNWEQGASNLLDQVDFGKKAVKNTRFMLNNLIAKATLAVPLQGLVALMNRKECPREVFQMILDRMPDIRYEEYGSRNAFIAEVVALNFDGMENPSSMFDLDYGFWERFAFSFLLQENRTRNHANAYYTQLIGQEAIPPYKWAEQTIEKPLNKEGSFWWLFNAGGKCVADRYIYDPKAFKAEGIFYRSYGIKSFYDMARISAELHLEYSADKPVRETLESLKTYQTLIDPCSGKPYVWNEERQVLYGIGTDCTDNGGGDYNITSPHGSDYVIPVILFLK